MLTHSRRLLRLALPICAVLIGCAGPSQSNVNCAVRPASFRSSTDNLFEGHSIPFDTTFYVIKVDRSGRLAFQKQPVTVSEVAKYLDAAGQMQPPPFISLDFDAGAPCDRIEEIRRMMNKALDCSTTKVCLQGPV